MLLPDLPEPISCQGDNVIQAPCHCWVTAVPVVTTSKAVVCVNGVDLSISAMVKDCGVSAHNYLGGSAIVCFVEPTDFCPLFAFTDGTLEDSSQRTSALVVPDIISTLVLQTPWFGRVTTVVAGSRAPLVLAPALADGSVHQGQPFSILRCSSTSCVVVMLFDADTVEFNGELLAASEAGLPTLVSHGTSLAQSKPWSKELAVAAVPPTPSKVPATGPGVAAGAGGAGSAGAKRKYTPSRHAPGDSIVRMTRSPGPLLVGSQLIPLSKRRTSNPSTKPSGTGTAAADQLPFPPLVDDGSGGGGGLTPPHLPQLSNLRFGDSGYMPFSHRLPADASSSSGSGTGQMARAKSPTTPAASSIRAPRTMPDAPVTVFSPGSTSGDSGVYDTDAAGEGLSALH